MNSNDNADNRVPIQAWDAVPFGKYRAPGS